MVPRVSADTIRWPGELDPGHLSSVYIDQPVERSLALLMALMPGKSRIGVIVSPENMGILKTLEREAARRGLILDAEMVDDFRAVGPSLRKVLSDIDVFLLLPDAVVLNGANLKSLLVASYRLRVPVLGFSPGLVKSGAVAAVFSTPNQIGMHGAGMALRWLSSGQLPPPQHAAQYSVDINHYVARSLGLSLQLEREVVKALGAQN
jgi:ABC-type uncharacterized transport system substrate-binding protein